MSYQYFTRVRETTSTSGTGPITLGGAQTGYRAFGSVLTTGQTATYLIVDYTTGAWESGSGTYTTSSNTLSRDTVFESSNAGQLVVFGSTPKDIWYDFAAASVNSLVSLANGAVQSSGLTAAVTTLLGANPVRILSPIVSVVGAGTNQATATPLSGQINIITSAATGGFVIPSSAIGQTIEVRNKDTVNTATIYPFAGGKIDTGTTNATVTLPAGSTAIFAVQSATQIWS